MVAPSGAKAVIGDNLLSDYESKDYINTIG